MEDTLRRLAQGQVPSSQLPRAFSVDDLRLGLAELCHRAFKILPQAEWGACILLQGDHLRLTHHVGGWKTGVTPNCEPGEHRDGVYVGFVHVHLPDKASGKHYMGFSSQDYRATLADGDNLALVCNGPEVYALVRTSDKTRKPEIVGDKEFSDWQDLYSTFIQQAKAALGSTRRTRTASGAILDQALWQANREICIRLGFAFYRGLWGDPLVRVLQP